MFIVFVSQILIQYTVLKMYLDTRYRVLFSYLRYISTVDTCISDILPSSGHNMHSCGQKSCDIRSSYMQQHVESTVRSNCSSAGDDDRRDDDDDDDDVFGRECSANGQ